MNTDRLIDALSTNLEPVRRGQLTTTLTTALVIGAVAAFCLMLVTLGLRPEFGAHLGFVAVKLLFALSLVGLGAVFLLRLMRPGWSVPPIVWLLNPFLAIGVAALVVTWGHSTGPLVRGTLWAVCLSCIPLFAAVPFAALVWAVRNGAPTDLRRAGAIIGLVAGAVGAAAYAFYCPDDSLPFIAVWYSAAIALCALVGALLGPRLLRW